LTACPAYTTNFFLEKGYILENKNQRVNDVLVLSSDYFCPMDFRTGIVNRTNNTVGIHWYEASWYGEGDKAIHLVEMKIRRRFPNKLGIIFSFFYRKGYRFLEYHKKGILKAKIIEKFRR
jgi:hypothetical protein